MTPTRYANLGGDSGVTHYAIGDGVIAVQFQDSTVYIYDRESPGPFLVAQMQRRAIEGRGLGTYISQHVREAYARKQANW